MTTNHNFNSFDVRMEDSTSIAGRIVLIIMLIVFLAASMITTFSFFYTYAPGLGRVIHPDYAGYVAGTMGVLLFDLAGLGWTVLRSRNSDTTHQFTIATLAAITTIVLSLITSGLYVALSSAFDIGLYTTGGSLSQFGQAMQIAGVAIMTLGFVLNFGAIAAYVNVSRETAQAVHQTQMRGYVAQGRFAADRTRAQLELERTLANIMRDLPALAALQARTNAAGYLDHSFNQTGPAAPAIDDAARRARLDDDPTNDNRPTMTAPPVHANGAPTRPNS